MRGLLKRPIGADVGTPDGDAVLVRLAQTSPSAFEPLYVRYRDRVLGYCYRRLGDRDEAEDAASSVFVAALRGLPGFRDRDDSFRAWLFRIAHNEVAMRHRHRVRHPVHALSAARDELDPGRSPEELAIVADGQRRLAAMLGDLPPRERNVLELRLADLTTTEIARVLSISEQTVRTAQCRAVARLRTGPAVAGTGRKGPIDG